MATVVMEALAVEIREAAVIVNFKTFTKTKLETYLRSAPNGDVKNIHR